MNTLLFRDNEQIEHILKMEVGIEEKLTVRRGSKWNTDPEEIRIEQVGSHFTVIFGDIVYTKLMKFSDCKDEINQSHFMFLSYEQVLAHLQKVYPNFTENEIVTLVYFRTK